MNLPEPSEAELAEIAREGRENPLPEWRARRLMRKIVRRIRRAAERAGDTETVEAYRDEDAAVERLMEARRGRCSATR